MKNGAIGGVVGGVIFGMIMQMMGVMPMIAMMVGSESIGVGWILHLIISAFTGALFGLLFEAKIATSYSAGAGYGLLYGAIWWVLGALILMPAFLGMNDMIFKIGEMQMFSLMGHIIWGVVMGLIVVKLQK